MAISENVLEVLKETPIHHPSSIYEWYTEGKRHPDGGKAFVAFPDFLKALNDLEEKLTTKPHGVNRYALGCRCEKCKEAKRLAMRNYRNKKRGNNE